MTVNASVTGVQGVQHIGTLCASVSPAGGMFASFTLAPAFRSLASVNEFHWLQVITQDDCEGTAADVAPRLPVVDPPAYGWDYMYEDTDHNCTITIGERRPDNAAHTCLGATTHCPRVTCPDGHSEGINCAQCAVNPDFRKQVADAQPWYNDDTTDAFLGRLSATADGYAVWDAPGACPGTGTVRFETYLTVGTNRSICILAGFSWTRTANGYGAPIPLGELSAARVGLALAHGDIDGWAVSANACCALKKG